MISLLAALALAPEPFRFVQIPAMVDYNSGLQERALDEAQRLSAGITVSVGFTDASGIAAQARFPTWKYFEQVVGGALDRKISKIRLKIGGGPPPHPSWLALNDGQPWEEPYRPPHGPDNALWKRLVYYKQAVIDRAVTLVQVAKRDPKQVLEIELATEPGKGGSGGPWRGAPGAYGPAVRAYPEGVWDLGFHEELSFECQNLDFRGLPVLSPSFEFQSDETFAQELSSAQSAMGEGWRSKVNVWVVNVYAQAKVGPDGSLEGPLRAFAAKALKARDAIRRTFGQNVPIVVGEYGWTAKSLGVQGRSDAEGLRGRALRESESLLKQAGFLSASLYTMVDDRETPGFGMFDRRFSTDAVREGFLAAP